MAAVLLATPPPVSSSLAPPRPFSAGSPRVHPRRVSAMMLAMTDPTLYFWQAPFADFRHVEDQPRVLEVLRRVAALAHVEGLLGLPPTVRSQLRPEAPRPEAAKDGYRLATRVRALLDNESGPIDDPRELLEDRFGVLVLALPLSSTRVHALTLKDNVTNAVAVVVNSAGERFQNPQALRVDLFHELAHVLFDPPNGDINLVVDDADGADSKKHVEQRARAFAAEMLMPAEGLRRLLGKPSYEIGLEAGLQMVEKTRSFFGTPVEITVNHLVNREHIVDWNREALIDRARMEYAPSTEHPALFAQDRPSLLEQRAGQAIVRNLLTRERARRLLDGKLDLTPRAALTVDEALTRLRAAGLAAEAIPGPDVHILGGKSTLTAGEIRAYEDGFAILSEPGLGFTVLLSGPGQLGETHTFPGLSAAVEAIVRKATVPLGDSNEPSGGAS
ncbi:MAG: ImmA/IrrE family metallo-endopeptidase [Polyangiaceae bacterium]